jgi:hypothetical protein
MIVSMLVAPFLMAPVTALTMIVGLSAAGSGEEQKTGAEGGADEMAETHWAIPPLTSEGTQAGSRIIPKKIEASSKIPTAGFCHIRAGDHKKDAPEAARLEGEEAGVLQRRGIVKLKLGPTGSG